MFDDLKIIAIVLGSIFVASLSVGNCGKSVEKKIEECKCDNKSKKNASGSWFGSIKK